MGKIVSFSDRAISLDVIDQACDESRLEPDMVMALLARCDDRLDGLEEAVEAHSIRCRAQARALRKINVDQTI